MAYAIIPEISQLEEPLLSEVRNAFAESLKIIWQVMIGVAGLGLLSVLLMREIPMHTEKDETYGLAAAPLHDAQPRATRRHAGARTRRPAGSACR